MPRAEPIKVTIFKLSLRQEPSFRDLREANTGTEVPRHRSSDLYLPSSSQMLLKLGGPWEEAYPIPLHLSFDEKCNFDFIQNFL